MKTKLKVLSLASMIVPFAITVVGCGGGKKKQDDDGKVILSCWLNEGNKWEGMSKDTIVKAIEEKCGVSLDVSGATHNSDYYTTLNPKINTGEIPDIIFTVPSAQGNAYNNWIQQDLLWNYDELLAEKPGEYPYLEAIFNSKDYKNIQYGDSMHTMLPFFNSRNGWTIYYRSDWLIKVGYYTLDDQGNKVAKVPVTMDEFQDVLKKFTENDPDGNGKKDTYGISPGGTCTWFNPLFHAFDVTVEYDLDKNDEPIYQRLQPEFKNFLGWANDMYNKGYIDPQFVANVANTDDREKFYRGDVGVLITNGESHVQWVVNGVEKVFGKNTIAVGPAPIGTATVGVEGAHGFSDWGGWWGGFSLSKECSDPHAALRFLNYINGPEGNTLFHYGIKDVHYTVDADGNKVPNVDERMGEPNNTFYEVTTPTGEKAPIGMHQLGMHMQTCVEWNEDGKTFKHIPDASSIPYEYKDFFKKTVEINEVRSSRIVNVTCWPSAYTTKMKKIEDYADQFAMDAIMGKKNLTSDWDQLLEDVERTSYEWSSVKKMIKEVARKCGIIK